MDMDRRSGCCFVSDRRLKVNMEKVIEISPFLFLGGKVKKKKELSFVYINENYLNYLKKYDVKVPEKINRVYIGALLKIENKEYFAPLSSPKDKHKTIKNNIDVFKIKNGKLGIINLNNMIPVLSHSKCREVINLSFLKNSNDTKDNKYFYLLNDQLKFCKKNKRKLLEKAENIHKIFTKEFDELKDWQKKMYSRINNFKLLEFACEEYQDKYIKDVSLENKERVVLKKINFKKRTKNKNEKER